mmetsp:Transcript_3889/g.13783  ORF Transcript_3889/g.13783 Transcript_3889/m.13783 type:complete len:317 (-) Transcript_3889:1061-2011(-)
MVPAGGASREEVSPQALCCLWLSNGLVIVAVLPLPLAFVLFRRHLVTLLTLLSAPAGRPGRHLRHGHVRVQFVTGVLLPLLGGMEQIAHLGGQRVTLELETAQVGAEDVVEVAASLGEVHARGGEHGQLVAHLEDDHLLAGGDVELRSLALHLCSTDEPIGAARHAHRGPIAELQRSLHAARLQHLEVLEVSSRALLQLGQRLALLRVQEERQPRPDLLAQFLCLLTARERPHRRADLLRHFRELAGAEPGIHGVELLRSRGRHVRGIEVVPPHSGAAEIALARTHEGGSPLSCPEGALLHHCVVLVCQEEGALCH